MKKVLLTLSVLFLISCNSEKEFPLRYSYSNIEILESGFFVIDGNNNLVDITESIDIDLIEYENAIIQDLELNAEQEGFQSFDISIDDETTLSYINLNSPETLTLEYTQNGSVITFVGNSDVAFRFEDDRDLLQICTDVSVVQKGRAVPPEIILDYQFNTCIDFESSLENRLMKYIDGNNAPGDTAYIALSAVNFKLK